jgi:hypothetical protein
MKPEKGDRWLAHPLPATLFLLTALILALAALRSWARVRDDRVNLVTDGAGWIWPTLDIGEEKPIHFWTWLDFHVDRAPGTARVKLFVDPRGMLTVNGSKFGAVEQRAGSPLAVFEVGSALAAGANRVVVEAESPTGAGGILFCLDLPGRPAVVSDSSWRVASSESSVGRDGTPARVWGRPPMYPWGYPRLGPRASP